MSIAVIIPAAGTSSRYGGARNKLFEQLAGLEVLLRSLDAFLSRLDVALIVIPTRLEGGRWSGATPRVIETIERHPGRIRLCAGGDSRARSVLHALREVPESIEWVAVHDGARPLVSQALIDRTLGAAIRYGAAVPAMPVQLTIKEAAGPLPARVERTIPRQSLWAMQTPQIARRADLLRAFDTCPIPLAEVTDDVQLIELAGGEVWLVEGEERNLKITTQNDLAMAAMLLRGDS